MNSNKIKMQKTKSPTNRLDDIDLNESAESAESTRKKLIEAYTIINQSSSVAITWKNAEGWPVEFVTRNVERLFGYTAEEFMKGTISYDKCIHPDDLQRVTDEVEKFSKQAETSEFVHEPYRIITKDGSVRIIKDWTFITRNKMGQITHYKGIVEDITEQIQTENELRHYEHIVSCSNDMMALLDNNFTYLAANEKYVSAFGKTRDEMIGSTVAEIFGETFFETIIKPNAEKCLRGEQISYQDWFEFPKTGKRFMEITYYPYRNQNNSINGFMVNGRDITQRKLAEEKLEEKNRLTQIILDSLPFPAMLIRKNRVIIASNKVARDVGAKDGGFCWRDFGQTDYIPEDDKEFIITHKCVPDCGTKCTFCLADETFSNKKTQNSPSIEAFGRIWDIYWIPIDDEVYLHFAIDITERKQMEKKLRKRTYDLGERVKELGCLYSISKLIQSSGYSYKDILQGVIDIIPPSMQYPEITCSRLTIENEEIKTCNFIETNWQIKSKILVSNKKVGLLEIGYLEKRPKRDEGSFLKEERSLIDAITERLGRYIEQKRAEDALSQSNEKLIIEQNALKEKNITLKEVLNQIEKEKQQIAIQTQSNIDRVVIPILNKLEEKILPGSEIYAKLMRNSLNEITHPFINNMETHFSKLTPREIEICNFIKNGLSSKEIASTLNTSVGTVFNQRKTIRKKLGIANDEINLSSFLHTR